MRSTIPRRALLGAVNHEDNTSLYACRDVFFGATGMAVVILAWTIVAARHIASGEHGTIRKRVAAGARTPRNLAGDDVCADQPLAAATAGSGGGELCAASRRRLPQRLRSQLPGGDRTGRIHLAGAF